ncbi:hypothetical protein EG346_10050 [Chryseobacterium carnipullorum]|uniref:Uncharacterized protein n=1 Tax=Chryseobacterium carnipullorum TaxID=1124835 RepID=A0A376DNN5_CHRCU|nr:DUF6037 family protein [Chryseobacterium carnipullorum]AZA48506.1 hypothetical protein EG346_10050 [Chryseobacterium carnipullorum]AZA63432.1 hypothetical protein EG345_00950 [Chryseobacterium carnipullorum]STC92513.1 Uncharacterised protein [Chryseobacterium carnipullorum]
MKSAHILQNLKLLKEDMEDKGWVIEAFTFNYKNISYIVLVKLYVEDEIRPEYALLKLEFIKANDSDHTLIVPANSNQIMITPQILREFFNINYSTNLRDILQQFYEYFSGFIPTQVNLNQPDYIKKIMVSSLSKSDSEDPDKIYCYTVKRNPNNEKRSPFNDNKTQLLRPTLYARFKEERIISFCYSLHQEKQKTDEEILLNFGKRR